MSVSIYQLKPRFQQLLRPALDRLAAAGLTPNQVTLAAGVLSMSYGGILAAWPAMPALWLGLPFFLLLRMALNAIDGMLAKHTGRTTPLGALLNEICDQISDIALALPFLLAAGVDVRIGVAAIIAGLLAEFAGVCAALIGVPRRFDGPMGKSDRAFAYGLAAVWIGFGVFPALINALLGLIAGLSLVTVGVRLRQALKACAQPTL